MFAERLKVAREVKGWSQNNLAQKLEMNTAQIWRYEAGKALPSADVLKRLAEILECSADYLLGLTNAPTSTVTKSDLSPDEQILLNMLRKGGFNEILRALIRVTDLPKEMLATLEEDQP